MANLIGQSQNCNPDDCEPEGLTETQSTPPTDPTPPPPATVDSAICTSETQYGRPIDCEEPTDSDPHPAPDKGFEDGLNTVPEVEVATPLSPCECSPDQTIVWVESNTGSIPTGPVLKIGSNCYTHETKQFFEVENVPIVDPSSITGGFSSCDVCCNEYILATQCSCDDSNPVANGVYVKK